MEHSILWIYTVILFLIFIAADLLLYNKYIGDKKPSFITAATWSIIWVSIGLSFSIFIYYAYENHWFGLYLNDKKDISGTNAALTYISAFLIEESLSVDNLFVMAMIFEMFNIPVRYQHNVLYLGILGAIIFRATFIIAGIKLISLFTWTFYIFGALLLYSSYKMITQKNEDFNIKDSRIYQWIVSKFRITDKLYRNKLFVKLKDNKVYATPLFLALLAIEMSDLIFAVDSIPAVFAVTTDSYIAFTSNILAVMGLRSIYFVLAYMVLNFDYLHYSLAAILAFIGFKLFVHHWFIVPVELTLSIIVVFLLAGIIYSKIKTSKE